MVDPQWFFPETAADPLQGYQEGGDVDNEPETPPEVDPGLNKVDPI